MSEGVTPCGGGVVVPRFLLHFLRWHGVRGDSGRACPEETRRIASPDDDAAQSQRGPEKSEIAVLVQSKRSSQLGLVAPQTPEGEERGYVLVERRARGLADSCGKELPPWRALALAPACASSPRRRIRPPVRCDRVVEPQGTRCPAGPGEARFHVEYRVLAKEWGEVRSRWGGRSS
jgi:hypothetical protein